MFKTLSGVDSTIAEPSSYGLICEVEAQFACRRCNEAVRGEVTSRSLVHRSCALVPVMNGMRGWFLKMRETLLAQLDNARFEQYRHCR